MALYPVSTMWRQRLWLRDIYLIFGHGFSDIWTAIDLRWNPSPHIDHTDLAMILGNKTTGLRVVGQFAPPDLRLTPSIGVQGSYF